VIGRLGLQPEETPASDETKHPDCFFEGLRLIGHDGTTLSRVNTEAVLEMVSKSDTRRGKAAFAKMRLGVLVGLRSQAPETTAQEVWDSGVIRIRHGICQQLTIAL